MKRIIEAATQNVAGAAQSGYEEDARGPENGSESHLTSTHDTGDSNSGSDEGQTQPQPTILTSKEILAKLPKFDETSYGSDSFVDLTGTSEWQIRTQQSGFDRGGGGSSGGVPSFKNLQAYRDAYGIRGEEWVTEQEKHALREAGKPSLAEAGSSQVENPRRQPMGHRVVREILSVQAHLC